MRISAVVCSLLFVVSCALQQGSQVKTVSGWVSDAACGAEHVGGKGADCVRKCIKGGAHIGHPEWEAQAMVLVVDDTNQILIVDNPDTLTGREAQHVIVQARVDGERMHVVELLR